MNGGNTRKSDTKQTTCGLVAGRGTSIVLNRKINVSWLPNSCRGALLERDRVANCEP